MQTVVRALRSPRAAVDVILSSAYVPRPSAREVNGHKLKPITAILRHTITLNTFTSTPTRGKHGTLYLTRLDDDDSTIDPERKTH